MSETCPTCGQPLPDEDGIIYEVRDEGDGVGVTARRGNQVGWALGQLESHAKHKAKLRLLYAEEQYAEEQRRIETWAQVEHLPVTERLAAWEKLLGYRVAGTKIVAPKNLLGEP